MGEIQKATGKTAEPAAAPASTAVAVRAPASPMEAAQAAYQHTLDAKVRYAKTLAASGLLPRAYQNNPANVLWALEYGEALGISPMTAITGIHVIEGKPVAGAGLISGLIQHAGHRLRVRGDDKKAICEITRSDDPSYTFNSEWTMDRARQAGLTGKQVWKNYPAAMLRARAITECGRAACQDVLVGLGYTAEELGEDTLPDEYAPEEFTPAAASDDGGKPVAPDGAMLEAIGAEFRRLGTDSLTVQGGKAALDACSVLVDRAVTSPQDLTRDEAEHIITELEGCEDAGALEALVTEMKAATQ